MECAEHYLRILEVVNNYICWKSVKDHENLKYHCHITFYMYHITFYLHLGMRTYNPLYIHALH